MWPEKYYENSWDNMRITRFARSLVKKLRYRTVFAPYMHVEKRPNEVTPYLSTIASTKCTDVLYGFICFQKLIEC